MENENLYNVYSEERTGLLVGKLMQKTYLWMTFGLIITALTALYVAGNKSLLMAIFSSSTTYFILIIAELFLVGFLAARIHKLSLPVATVMFMAYSALNGATLSILLLHYAPEVIATTFFVTAGTFAAMSLVGFVVKRDLSAGGKFLMVCLFGIIIATVVNMFMHSPMLHMLISYVGVVVFAGLTAYDTQKLRLMFEAAGDDMTETHQKMALLGSLTLYLDFINLFLFLLRIFGGGSDD